VASQSRRTYEQQLRGDHITAAVAERLEASRRAPQLGCPDCSRVEACSQHLAEQLMEAVREEDLVFMPLTEADAIIRGSVARLIGQARQSVTVGDVEALAAQRGLPAGTTLAEFIEHECTQARLAGTFDALARLRTATDAAEDAFDTLLKIAAFGFHTDHRDELREETVQRRTAFRAAAGTCPGCGHDPHDPPAGETIRSCPACTGRATWRQHCTAARDNTGAIRYLH
jgi:hypothetical protein